MGEGSNLASFRLGLRYRVWENSSFSYSLASCSIIQKFIYFYFQNEQGVNNQEEITGKI